MHREKFTAYFDLNIVKKKKNLTYLCQQRRNPFRKNKIQAPVKDSQLNNKNKNIKKNIELNNFQDLNYFKYQS